jgi:hypothetical protein
MEIGCNSQGFAVGAGTVSPIAIYELRGLEV